MIVLLASITIALIIALLAVRGIDYMNEHHSDYKGEDFLNND